VRYRVAGMPGLVGAPWSDRAPPPSVAIFYNEHSQLYYLPTLLAAESAVDWLSSTSKRDFSFRELLPDFKQFLATLVARFWIGHFKTFKRIENNTRNDQPSVLFVIAGMTYQRASRVLVAPRHSSYAFMYRTQKFLSVTSATLNFQFFSGSSMRSRKRFRCSSFDRWR